MGVENLSRTLELVTNDEGIKVNQPKYKGYRSWNLTEAFMIEADIREWKFGLSFSRYGFDVQIGPISIIYSK